MYLLLREQTDPYFNLAAEEYLLKHGPGDLFMLWQNQPSVIIGKHQNPYAETNYRYISKHGIPIVRRISGGGTVYHDLGNINFTFIQQVGPVNPVKFSRFTLPMMELLAKFGLPVNAGQRNDLLVNGLKFSGNAEHVFRDKVLHHGTILFNSDLEILGACLDAADNRFAGKSVPSVRSDVANLASFLPEQITAEHFMYLLFDKIQQELPVADLYELTDNDIHEIEKIAVEKYRTWQWNFGYSPVYSFIVKLLTLQGILKLSIKVENGCFIEVIPDSIFERNPGVEEMIHTLKQQNHCEHNIRTITRQFEEVLAKLGITAELFVDSFF